MKGITSASTTRWQVQIAHGGKQHYIGTYKTELEAALAYDAAARRHRPVKISQSTFTHLECGHTPSQALNSADRIPAPL